MLDDDRMACMAGIPDRWSNAGLVYVEHGWVVAKAETRKHVVYAAA